MGPARRTALVALLLSAVSGSVAWAATEQDGPPVAGPVVGLDFEQDGGIADYTDRSALRRVRSTSFDGAWSQRLMAREDGAVAGFRFPVPAQPAGTTLRLLCFAKSRTGSGDEVHVKLQERLPGDVLVKADTTSRPLTGRWVAVSTTLTTRTDGAELTGAVFSTTLGGGDRDRLWVDTCSVDRVPAPGPGDVPQAPPTDAPAPSPGTTPSSPAPTAAATATSAPASPVPSPGTSRPGPAAPSGGLDLSGWKLTLPVDENGDADGDCEAREVLPPQLGRFRMAPWFHEDARSGGILFRADVEGCTTSGSSYPRSELRELTADGSRAAWSATSGRHELVVRQAVTHLPVAKPQVVTAQIHDADDDVVEILADGSGRAPGEPVRLCYRFEGEQQDTCLDDAYRLGTPYEVTLTVVDGTITIGYEGRTVATERHTGSGNYFKTGAYTQSNPDRGDAPGAYGEVLVLSAVVRHS